MTKRLLLLRHAQSDPSYEGKDKGRPLTMKGISDAAALGYYMSKNNLYPDYVLCSDSWRTRETLEQLRECFNTDLSPNQISFLPVLYLGSEEQYLKQIHLCDDEYDTVLLIGHYPGIPALLRMLASSSEKLTFSLISGYQPATLSILSCSIKHWSDLNYSSKNILIDTVSPDDYAKK
ncbi:MAG: histidine phosphatase family protein [Alphaproteobacteria bacterium]|nr:histidine phosphatase family protein [Alphaproteobacteria bacterium]